MKLKIDELRIGKVKGDRFFMNTYLLENGKENRHISKSPHYKLLKAYEHNPRLNLKKTDYFAMAMRHLHNRGNFCEQTTEEDILEHTRKFCKLFDTIKERGFDYSKGKIVVFKTVIGQKPIDNTLRPHPPTPTYEPEDYEIVDGHHRASILAALGYKEIEVDTYSKYVVVRNQIREFVQKKTNQVKSIIRK